VNPTLKSSASNPSGLSRIPSKFLLASSGIRCFLNAFL
jgi:hypothetical protein